MTHYERIHNMMAGKPCDHVPCTPILMQYAAHYIDRSYGDFTRDHAVLSEANIRCQQDFGFDQVSAISDPFRETSAFGAEIHIDDRLGPQCHTPILEDEIDFGLLKRPDPLSSPRMLDRIEGIRKMRAHYGADMSVLGWIEGPAAETADLRGPGEFLMDMIEEPDDVDALMAHCVDIAIEFAHAQKEAGIDVMGIGDAIASQVSGKMYEEQIVPHQKRLIQALRDMGLPVRLHICGNITHLLDGISQLPINSIDVDHMVDLAVVREKLGRSVMIGANLNPVTDVKNGSPESIREALLSAYRKAGNPFNSGAGCEIPTGTPVENLTALCQPLAYNPAL